MDLDTLRNLLQGHGLSPNKTYGQNFLMDEMVLHRMVEAAEVSKKDNVLEVGPGIGNLTRILIEQAGQVVAVEKDEQFLSVLKKLKKNNSNFDFVIDDILRVEAEQIFGKKSYKVVANIPYYVTGKIIQHFVTAKNKPKSMTLLMQKEVAKNLTAKAGKLNMLAISVQLFAEARLVEEVKRDQFYPKPKVDSAVVQINFFDKQKYKIPDQKKLFKLLRACFVGKRKQIHNTLKNNLLLPKEKVETILQVAKVKPEARPQELTIEQWLKLSEQI